MGEQRKEAHNRIEGDESAPGTSLEWALTYFDRLTRERNSRELPTPLHRALHLESGVKDMRTLITESKADEETRLKLLRVPAAKLAVRIFTAMEGLGTKKEFIATLIDDYAVCHRCKNNPCTCFGVTGPNDEPSQRELGGEENWTIEEWQEHFKGLYGANNDAKKDLLGMIEKVSTEVTEMGTAILEMDRAKKEGKREKAEEMRLAALRELGQSFAWLLGLCNHKGVTVDSERINLEEMLIAVYGEGCPNCKKFPCKCRGFSWKETRKEDPAELLKLLSKEG